MRLPLKHLTLILDSVAHSAKDNEENVQNKEAVSRIVVSLSLVSVGVYPIAPEFMDIGGVKCYTENYGEIFKTDLSVGEKKPLQYDDNKSNIAYPILLSYFFKLFNAQSVELFFATNQLNMPFYYCFIGISKLLISFGPDYLKICI